MEEGWYILHTTSGKTNDYQKHRWETLQTFSPPLPLPKLLRGCVVNVIYDFGAVMPVQRGGSSGETRKRMGPRTRQGGEE